MAPLVREHRRLPSGEPLHLEVDDLSREPVRALIAQHLASMHAQSPRESVHALGIAELRRPEVTFWSAWVGEVLAGCGALKRIDAARGEIKSMRVAGAYLGKGVGWTILQHITAEAQAGGMTSLWLETGSGPGFVAAHRLYERAGFVRCGPFDGYVADPFSVYMTRAI